MRASLIFAMSFMACSSRVDGPRPELADPTPGALPLDPGLVCNEQLTTEITISGAGISPMPVDLADDARVRLPSVALVRHTTLVGDATDSVSATYSGERDGSNAARLGWVARDAMTLVVDADVVLDDGTTMLPPGIYDVGVTNPNGHDATSVGALAVVPRPTLSDIAPGIVCLAQGPRTIALSGSGLIEVDGRAPSVFVGDMQAGADVVLGDCSAIAHAGISARTCGSGTAELASGLVAPGLHGVSLTNPDPAACISTDPLELRVVPPPIISSFTPSVLCIEDGAQPVTVRGAGFLRIDGALPSVTVAGTATTVTSLGGCEALATEGHVVETCSELVLDLTAAQLVIGDPTVVVTNPDPAGCDATAEAALAIVGPPDVTSVVPDAFCQADGGSVTVSGAGFAPSASVRLEELGAVVATGTVTFVSTSELAVTFAGGMPAGVYDLVVDNGAGCVDVLPLAVEVQRSPLVLFVDPPVVYSGITIDATIYVSGLTSEASEVALIGPSSEVVPLVAAPSAEPNRIAATIPAGLADGEWDVRVTSDVGCIGTLEGGLDVTSDLSVTIDTIDPAYAWTGAATAVTLTSSGGDFAATPRAYLNPKGAPEGTRATSMRAVLFADATTLTGVVPAGLAADQQYEVIVVNPDATVGVFDALTITADPPPVVTAIVPASLDGNEAQVATIQGASFASEGVTVSMVCRDPLGVEHGPLTVVPVNGTLTATAFDATFPVDQVPTGSVCVVTVTNPDGAAYRYSALSTKTPAQNLNPWRAAPDMVEARRGLGLVAQRPTGASRFVYALGGDDGTTAGAKATIEVSSVGVFGDMNVWTTLPVGLPGPRTLAGTVAVGRFIYMIGGNDGAAPVATVWRAAVLDPLAAPEVIDVGVSIDEEEPIVGIGEGTWVYRIAATFPDDDASNPSGESLPGEPFVVQLPAVEGLALTLRWDAIPGADGYRVYRSRAPAAADGTQAPIELIGTAAFTAFTDLGASTTIDAVPLPPGSLGAWHAVAALGSAREAPAVAVAPDPDTADRFYVYAFGGRGSDGSAMATWEVASVDVSAAIGKGSERQVVGAWVPGNDALASPRAEAGAWVVGPRDVAGGVVGDERWILVGSGRGDGGVIDALDAGKVLGDGRLGADDGTPGLVSPDKSPPAGAGYGAAIANGFLFIFGGAGGAPSNNGVSGELCVGLGVGGCNPDELPELRNWNSLGISLGTARYLPGTAQESAFFFIAGGASTGGVTATVEMTVQ